MDFKETKAYPLVKEFILMINNSVKNEKQIAINKDHVLFKIKQIVISTPLSEAKGRYANPAMVNVIEEIEKLTNNNYLKNSFGNKIRMDFGTGHELNFLCFLYSCFKNCQPEEKNEIKNLNNGNAESIINNSSSSVDTISDHNSDPCDIKSVDQISAILTEYFSIIRLYVSKFNVEAAGSRGCWSIDDYLLLPYLFGSAENFNDPRRIDCIANGMFREAFNNNHSVMLKDLCKLYWPAINVGMYKMYVEEVLGRYVVTQHFIYSTCLPQ